LLLPPIVRYINGNVGRNKRKIKLWATSLFGRLLVSQHPCDTRSAITQCASHKNGVVLRRRRGWVRIRIDRCKMFRWIVNPCGDSWATPITAKNATHSVSRYPSASMSDMTNRRCQVLLRDVLSSHVPMITLQWHTVNISTICRMIIHLLTAATGLTSHVRTHPCTFGLSEEEIVNDIETMCVLQLDIHQLSGMVKSQGGRRYPFRPFFKIDGSAGVEEARIGSHGKWRKGFHTMMTELPLTVIPYQRCNFQSELVTSLFRPKHAIVSNCPAILPQIKLSYRGSTRSPLQLRGLKCLRRSWRMSIADV
jgi:hypothetical protein